MRPYRAPGSEPPPDKTPVVLTYGPFTLRKTDLGAWTLEVPESFTSDDLQRLGQLAAWAGHTVSMAELSVGEGIAIGAPFLR